jgi:hypothetical protein
LPLLLVFDALASFTILLLSLTTFWSPRQFHGVLSQLNNTRQVVNGRRLLGGQLPRAPGIDKDSYMQLAMQGVDPEVLIRVRGESGSIDCFKIRAEFKSSFARISKK